MVPASLGNLTKAMSTQQTAVATEINYPADQAPVVVIMAGGAGTRFWPVSTERRPKQFFELVGKNTLFQQSYERARALTQVERILVLTSERFVELVQAQAPELPAENIIGEPMRRDTAAAIALAAALCGHRFDDKTVMLVFTSDHYIWPLEAFQRDLRSVVQGVQGDESALYTLGIKPHYPATSYGYLHLGPTVEQAAGIAHHELREFREKPDRETAQAYLDSGQYLWNSGMFAWQVGAIWRELEQHLPEHAAQMTQAARADASGTWRSALRRAFEPLPSISIDFGVMEKAARVRCIAASFQWSDVGGWLALEPFLSGDEDGNHVRGQLYTYEAENNIVFSEDAEEHVALVGVEGLVVVRSGNKTLVVSRERAEDVKLLVKELQLALR